MTPFAVFAAPLLWPVAAALQLLFPVVLRDRLRAYRWAITAVVGLSSIMLAAWCVGRWWPDVQATWLPPLQICLAMTALVSSCAVASLIAQRHSATPPRVLELAAFVVLLGASYWATFLAIPSLLTLVLLLARYRTTRCAPITPERVFLLCLTATTAWTALTRDQRGTTGPVPVLAGDWPTFRGSAARTGTLDTLAAGPMRPRVVWKYRAPDRGRIDASPIVIGDVLIVSTTHDDAALAQPFSRVVVLRLDTGTVVKSIDLPRAGFSSPAVSDRFLVIGEGYHRDRDCRLRTVDLVSGQVTGSVATASHVESSPTIVQDVVVFGAGDDGVRAATLLPDGQLQPFWHSPGHHADASPLVSDATVFIGSVPGDRMAEPRLLALDFATGRVKWDLPVPLPAIAAAAADFDGRVFFALGNGTLDRDADRPSGRLVCVSTSGQRLWDRPTTGSLYGSPVCMNGSVFIAAGDGTCQRLNAVDGSPIWTTRLAQRIVASPIVSGGAMYVVSVHGSVVRLDTATGHDVWRLRDLEALAGEEDVIASPFLAGGRLFVAVGGYVACVGDHE